MRSSSLLFFNIGLALVTAAPAFDRRQNNGHFPTFEIDYYSSASCDDDIPLGFLSWTDPSGDKPYNPNDFPQNCITDQSLNNIAVYYAGLLDLGGEFVGCTVTLYSDTYETCFCH